MEGLIEAGDDRQGGRLERVKRVVATDEGATSKLRQPFRYEGPQNTAAGMPRQRPWWSAIIMLTLYSPSGNVISHHPRNVRRVFRGGQMDLTSSMSLATYFIDNINDEMLRHHNQRELVGLMRLAVRKSEQSILHHLQCYLSLHVCSLLVEVCSCKIVSRTWTLFLSGCHRLRGFRSPSRPNDAIWTTPPLTKLSKCIVFLSASSSETDHQQYQSLKSQPCHMLPPSPHLPSSHTPISSSQSPTVTTSRPSPGEQSESCHPHEEVQGA